MEDPAPVPAPKSDRETVDESRRAFLRKSKYAIYATPIVTGLLVSRKAYALSYAAWQDCSNQCLAESQNGGRRWWPCVQEDCEGLPDNWPWW